jgi:hypothetical protein
MLRRLQKPRRESEGSMKKIVGTLVVVVALVAVGACGGDSGPVRSGSSGQEVREVNLDALARQETVAIELRWDPKENTCKLVRETPSEFRTENGALVTWVFFGPCPGTSIAIRRELARQGESLDLFEPDDETEGRRLRGTVGASASADPAPAAARAPAASGQMQVPGAEADAILILRARMQGNLTQGRYKYRVLIDGRPAQFNPDAEEGDFWVCPKWPCGGFSY